MKVKLMVEKDEDQKTGVVQTVEQNYDKKR